MTPTASWTFKVFVKKLRMLLANQQFLLLVVLLAMIGFFTALNPIFFSSAVFGNILLDWGPVVLIAVGETFVVISGGIDLSVGANVGLSGVVAAYAMEAMTNSHQGQNFTIFIGLLVATGVGTFIGLINALLITKARIVPFIATLATLGAAGGMSIVFTGGGPIAGGPDKAITLSVPWLGPLSTPGIVVIILVTVIGLFLHKARFGRYTYAIGSNSFAARIAGINVQLHLTKVYALSGLLAGLAGMYFYLRLGSGAPTSGAGGELDAIAAVVIGGASLSGGIGRMSGTILGAFILTTVTSGLIIIGVAPDWKQVVVAVLIAAAVLVQGLRSSARDI
ncbi:MAG: ABC transporter permease [Actinobacteria bacterium]|nr:ABC transporter permease [Actinomycetota bacterium]